MLPKSTAILFWSPRPHRAYGIPLKGVPNRNNRIKVINTQYHAIIQDYNEAMKIVQGGIVKRLRGRRSTFVETYWCTQLYTSTQFPNIPNKDRLACKVSQCNISLTIDIYSTDAIWKRFIIKINVKSHTSLWSIVFFQLCGYVPPEECPNFL